MKLPLQHNRPGSRPRCTEQRRSRLYFRVLAAGVPLLGATLLHNFIGILDYTVRGCPIVLLRAWKKRCFVFHGEGGGRYVVKLVPFKEPSFPLQRVPQRPSIC